MFIRGERELLFCFTSQQSGSKSQEERVRSQLGQYLDRFDSVYVEMALSCRMTNGTCNILLIAYLLYRERKKNPDLKLKYQFKLRATVEES